MANTEAKEMHNKDVVQQMWRPAIAIILPLIYGIGAILGTDFPTIFEVAAVGAPAGLMVDRALYKRRNVEAQAQSGDPK